MSKWYKVAVALLLVVALLVAFGCAPPPVEEEEEEVGEEVVVEEAKTATIGLLGALTGPLRTIAPSIYAIEDYMTYINDKGGIEYLDPKTGKTEHFKFKWLMGDHGWDSAKCISLYERFKAGGAIFMFSNGSVPSVSIYALMARDRIPGTPTGCTGELCFYEIDEPYLHADMGFMPGSTVAIMAYYLGYVWGDKPGKPKIGVMAADVGSRRVYDLPETHTYDAVEQMGGELLPVEYVPIAPVDMKIQFSRLAEEGVNFILFDHWGDQANRVFIHNAIDLKLWEKDITLLVSNPNPVLIAAEADVWDTYNDMGGKLLAGGVGWGGCQEEYDKYADNPKYWGVKLYFDLCKKYQDSLPEEVNGPFYSSGVKDGMILETVFKTTLEKYGYEGLTGERLREALFGLEVIDTGGILPPFIDDPGHRLTQPFFYLLKIEGGHVIFDPEAGILWVEYAPVWGKTSFNELDPRPDYPVYRDYMEPIL